jgi:hypothetical protein
MLKFFLGRWIGGFEKQWGYDASYMRELLEADPWGLLMFSFVSSLGRRPGATTAASAAAGIVGTLVEDCGPCTQIGVDIAAASGVSPDVLRAILAGDEAAMGADAGLAYRFARASLAKDMERADPLRDEIVARWGKQGLTAISLALTTARMYPTLKYALGHGKTCSRVTVSGVAAPFERPELLAA